MHVHSKRHAAATNARDTLPVRESKTRKREHAAESLELPREGLARLPAVLRAVAVSRTTWLAMVKAGRAPAPVRVGLAGHLTAWPVEALREWLAAREVAK